MSYRRIDAIDVLRGVAILGILVMNVRNFALPLRDFQRPSAAGGMGVSNLAAWLGADLLFEDKMIALLSLLFGAGLVLMDEHAADAPAEGRGFARRWFPALPLALRLRRRPRDRGLVRRHPEHLRAPRRAALRRAALAGAAARVARRRGAAGRAG
jgi:hypothetical protein